MNGTRNAAIMASKQFTSAGNSKMLIATATAAPTSHNIFLAFERGLHAFALSIYANSDSSPSPGHSGPSFHTQNYTKSARVLVAVSLSSFIVGRTRDIFIFHTWLALIALFLGVPDAIAAPASRTLAVREHPPEKHKPPVHQKGNRDMDPSPIIPCQS